MVKYRGYYIDNVVFNSKAEIDEHIKADHIKTMRKFLRMGFGSDDMGYALEAIKQASIHAKFLMDECGMSYDEVEQLQIL